MRLLIAGWQGQLARALVEAAAARPEIKAVALGRPGLDLVRPGTIHATLADTRPDIVINTAAYTAVDKAEQEETAAMALNAEGAGLIAAAAAKRGAAIIHISTDYVFDGAKPTPYVETDPTGPINAYGRSKLAGEQAVADVNPHHLILRTAWVHSPFGANFVKTMLRVGRERAEVRVVDDQTGSPTYAPHLARAILDIAAKVIAAGDGTPWGVYHAAGSGTVSWCGLAREVFAQSARRGGPIPTVTAIPTSAYPTPARRPANSRLDCGKLATTFGVRLPDWQVGVEDCVTRLLSASA